MDTWTRPERRLVPRPATSTQPANVGHLVAGYLENLSRMRHPTARHVQPELELEHDED